MIAICFKCAEQKQAPLQLCTSCGASPVLHAEREISLGLSDALSRPSELRRYANEIQNRLRLSIPDSTLAKARGTLANARLALVGDTVTHLRTPKQPAPLAAAPARPAPVHAAPPTPTAAGQIPAKETALHHSPFWVLGANTRDSRNRIVELAEEKALVSDPELCQKSRAELTNPRKRLAVEIGWLPGVSPRRAEKLLEQVIASPRVIRTESGLPALAHVNLLAAALETVGESYEPDDLAAFILQMAHAVAALDLHAIMRDINEDRSVSGFPELMGTDLIESELLERRRYYKNTIKEAVNGLTPGDIIIVMTKVVEQALSQGEEQALGLVDDLVDSYELESQPFLEAEAQNIGRLIEAIRLTAPSGELAIRPVIAKLEAVVKNWHSVVRPIQMSSSARGTRHPLSLKVAGDLRELSVDLFNKHDLLAVSKRLTALSQAVFAQLHELSEQINDDKQTLSDIEATRRVEELLSPIVAMCKTALECAENQPDYADEQARRLFDAASELLARPVFAGAAREVIDRAKDHVAATIMQCAIAYGNKVEKWQVCVSLLEKSAQLATDREIAARVTKNLEVVRGNLALLGDLSPISSAPSLSTINGIGFTLYGSTDRDSTSGSFMATYYFVFLAIPIFPLCRYRVVPTGGGYRFLGKGPLRPFDFAHIAISAGALIWMFAH